MLLSDALVVDVAEEEKSARAALCIFSLRLGKKSKFSTTLSHGPVGREDRVRAKEPLSFGYFVVVSVVHVPRARLFVLVFFRGPRFV